jgi:hypothetical protein
VSVAEKLRIVGVSIQQEVDMICYNFWLEAELEAQRKASDNRNATDNKIIEGLERIINSKKINRK